MKKLAVMFPGVGYTCAKPLLYYTSALAEQNGYEVVRLDYGPDVHSFRGRTREELRPVTETAVRRTMPQLAGVPGTDYEDILLISKSIGTVVACRSAEMLGIRAKHFLMTPIPDTLPWLERVEGLFVAGTADPYLDKELVLEAARAYPEKTGAIFEGCNHSLERRGDTRGNLENLRKVLDCLETLIHSL